MFINPYNRGKEENLPSKMDMKEIKNFSGRPLLHLNELKEQLLGDGLGEDAVDAKIMYPSVVNKDHVERTFDGHHLMMEGNHKNVFFCRNTLI